MIRIGAASVCIFIISASTVGEGATPLELAAVVVMIVATFCALMVELWKR